MEKQEREKESWKRLFVILKRPNLFSFFIVSIDTNFCILGEELGSKNLKENKMERKVKKREREREK
jgi:hypothetical protein